MKNSSFAAVILFSCAIVTVPARTVAAQQHPSRWSGVSAIFEDLDVGLARFSGCVSERDGGFVLASRDGSGNRTYTLKGKRTDIARAAGRVASVLAVRMGATMLVRDVRVSAGTCTGEPTRQIPNQPAGADSPTARPDMTPQEPPAGRETTRESSVPGDAPAAPDAPPTGRNPTSPSAERQNRMPGDRQMPPRPDRQPASPDRARTGEHNHAEGALKGHTCYHPIRRQL